MTASQQLPLDFAREPSRGQPSRNQSSQGRASPASPGEASRRSPSTAELSASLERLAVRQVKREFATLNDALFGTALRAPAFQLTVATSFLGRWVPTTRTIELNRSLLLEHSWGELVEVLKHEMAHQFVDEVLRSGDAAPHGELFQRVCSERGIDGAARGNPGIARGAGLDGDSPEGRVLDRISKLLGLAESPNVHEAEAAMTAARRLLLRHNIDAATSSRARSYSFRHLGEPKGRHSAAEKVLATILGNHFFVEAIWVPVWRVREGKRGNVLEVCGSVANLQIAEYVHGYLTETAERLWRDHRGKHGISRNKDRRTFLYGVMCGFRGKLEADEQRARGEGIVWVGDSDLKRYYRTRHPHVRTVWVGARGDAGAYRAGHDAGREIVLHRGVTAGSSQGSSPRLLPGRV